MADDQLNVPLEDSTLLEEVELVSALMIAATEHEERLDQREIDGLLGVDGAGSDQHEHQHAPQQPGLGA